MPAGVEPEVLEFSKISPILKEVETELRNLRTEKNNIINSPIDGARKREILDTLLSVENNMLKEVMDSLVNMDIEYIFDQTYTDNVKELGVIKGTLSSLIFGTAEDAFKENPREQ
jgi:trans-2-enoyl-CoA reductase